MYWLRWFLLLAVPQQVTAPKSTAELGPLQRTSKYEYEVKNIDGRRYLEMRLVGKEKWTRVEEIKCKHLGDLYESESFDYEYRCDFISPEAKKTER